MNTSQIDNDQLSRSLIDLNQNIGNIEGETGEIFEQNPSFMSPSDHNQNNQSYGSDGNLGEQFTAIEQENIEVCNESLVQEFAEAGLAQEPGIPTDLIQTVSSVPKGDNFVTNGMTEDQIAEDFSKEGRNLRELKSFGGGDIESADPFSNRFMFAAQIERISEVQ